MKLEDLDVGKVYECKLTKKKVLVIEQEKATEQATEENPNPKTKKVKIGKWANKLDDGTVTYLYQELFDGQLEV